MQYLTYVYLTSEFVIVRTPLKDTPSDVHRQQTHQSNETRFASAIQLPLNHKHLSPEKTQRRNNNRIC